MPEKCFYILITSKIKEIDEQSLLSQKIIVWSFCFSRPKVPFINEYTNVKKQYEYLCKAEGKNDISRWKRAIRAS